MSTQWCACSAAPYEHACPILFAQQEQIIHRLTIERDSLKHALASARRELTAEREARAAWAAAFADKERWLAYELAYASVGSCAPFDDGKSSST